MMQIKFNFISYFMACMPQLGSVPAAYAVVVHAAIGLSNSLMTACRNVPYVPYVACVALDVPCGCVPENISFQKYHVWPQVNFRLTPWRPGSRAPGFPLTFIVVLRTTVLHCNLLGCAPLRIYMYVLIGISLMCTVHRQTDRQINTGTSRGALKLQDCRAFFSVQFYTKVQF